MSTSCADKSVFTFFFMALLAFSLPAKLAYSQCSTLCMHERGDSSAGVSGSMLTPSYEVVFEDKNDAEADAAGENLLLAAEDAGAETTYIEAPSNKWQFTIIPYLWMMGINGKVGVKGRTVDADVSFSEIFENLDFAAEVHMEAWRDRFGFFIDATYSKISLTKNVTLIRDRTLKVKNVSQFFLGEFGGFYRVGTWPLGNGSPNEKKKVNTSFTLDLIGGGRYWWLEDDIDLKGPLGQNPQFSGSQDWFDFIAGGRVNLAINKFFIQVRSDVGGFGLGFSSDISWNIAGYIGYELPWYKITPIIGYRALYDKYSNGSGNNRFLWDAWMYGPQIGIGFQF